MSYIRSPICTVIGHVDHGKSSILDKIRGTSIVAAEAGGITQCISSTSISLNTIQSICGDLLKKLNIKFTIPGILFIDTPGHAAFTNLRKRGGNLADIAILVIDINEGVMPQTLECIEILKQYKTPFIIALNKIDLISGWRESKETLLQNIQNQAESVKQKIDNKLYELVGRLYELKLEAERFDRIEDHTKQVAIIPVSAQTGEGIPELLMVMTGLAQKYLEKNLNIEVKGPAKATILEVKEEKGLGTTLDVIIYDGTLKQNDHVVIGNLDAPITTKIRALFQPTDLKSSKFKSVKEVHAACGIKISAPNVDGVIAGMPLRAVANNLEQVKEEIQKEVEEVLIETDKEGIIIKADTLGSLEALIGLLKAKSIKIKKASVGDISKKDIAEATAEKEPLNKAILGFNVKSLDTTEAKIITHDVIYKIIEDFEKWIEEETKTQEAKELENLVKPCKIHILSGYVFRQNNPAVVGVEIQSGTLYNDTPLMKINGDKASAVKSMQSEGENIDHAERGKEAAISIPHLTVGRQIDEEDILYSDIPEEDFIKLKKLKKYLSKDEIKVLKEISEIKRKDNPVWGV